MLRRLPRWIDWLAASLCVAAIAVVAHGHGVPEADGPPATAAVKPPPSVTVHPGQTLLETFECNRCHQGADLTPATVDKDCVGCHQAIHDGRFEAPAEILKKWRHDIVHLRATPSLDAVGERFRRDWLEGFLLQPHDLRPRLDATMPRFAMKPGQAKEIAAYLVGSEATLRDAMTGFKRRGRMLLERKGCMTCHTMTGVPTIPSSPLPVDLTPDQEAYGVKLAPDLRHARDRLQVGTIAQWIKDPAAMKPGTPMPTIPMTDEQVEDIVAYLLEARLAPPESTTVPPRLPVLTREVRYDEVSDTLFQTTCWHCHSEPDLALGDGGPGNTGGFGFAPRGLNLRTYTSMASGSIGEDGERRSVFAKLANGTPRLVEHLYARHLEVAGRPVAGIRGMPLGLPPVSLETIQLVESWIAQGRPR
ncbi:MAG: cytochrome c1 [Myxococcota bacterium]|jgi:cytochrome c1